MTHFYEKPSRPRMIEMGSNVRRIREKTISIIIVKNDLDSNVNLIFLSPHFHCDRMCVVILITTSYHFSCIFFVDGFGFFSFLEELVSGILNLKRAESKKRNKKMHTFSENDIAILHTTTLSQS